MNRTRSALLDGARRATTVSGTKITMAQVAAAAGVAKATLYNHFRTREAVLDAFLLDEVARLLSDVDGKALPEALNAVASAISLRTLARTEPGTLAAIGRIDHGASAWQRAEAELAELLASAGRGGGETVLRWLASFVISPADPATIAADLAIIIAGLPDVGPDREVGDDSTPPALRESALRESALRESALRKSALRESALRESTPADSVFGGAPNSVRTA